MPPNDNGPGGETGAEDDEQPGGQSDVGSSVCHPYIVAVEMLAGSAERERAIFEAAWRTGYTTGFETGTGVGFSRAYADIDRAWADLAAKVRGLASSPSHAELERRRWDGRREDFGKPRPGDHLGGPKPWTPDAHTGRGTAA